MAATAHPANASAWPSAPPPDALLNTTSKGTPLWPPPAIFFKMEFSLSLAPDSRRNFAVDYASRPFDDSRLAKGLPRCLVPSAHRGRRASDQSRLPRSRSENPLRPSMPPPHPQQPPAHPPAHATASTQQPQQQQWPQQQWPQQPRPHHPHPHSQPYPHPPNPPRPTARRLLARQAIERKPLPEPASRFRLGEPELPWTSPEIPLCASPELPYSAISPPSAVWPALALPRGSSSSPTTPMVSPQATFASPARSRSERTLGTLSGDAQSLTEYLEPPARQETLAWNAQTLSWEQPERQRKLVWNARTQVWEAPPAPARHGPFSLETQPERPLDDGAAWPRSAGQRRSDSLLEVERDARAREERMLAVDPQRARELASMQSAMMSIDALGDASPWEPAGGAARGAGAGAPRDLGWAVRVEPAGEEGAGYWQAYNSEEWERAGRPWTYGDVNGFSSYWVAPRRRSWTGVPVGA